MVGMLVLGVFVGCFGLGFVAFDVWICASW